MPRYTNVSAMIGEWVDQFGDKHSVTNGAHSGEASVSTYHPTYGVDRQYTTSKIMLNDDNFYMGWYFVDPSTTVTAESNRVYWQGCLVPFYWERADESAESYSDGEPPNAAVPVPKAITFPCESANDSAIVTDVAGEQREQVPRVIDNNIWERHYSTAHAWWYFWNRDTSETHWQHLDR